MAFRVSRPLRHGPRAGRLNGNRIQVTKVRTITRKHPGRRLELRTRRDGAI
jgi:hypothetical protein